MHALPRSRLLAGIAAATLALAACSSTSPGVETDDAGGIGAAETRSDNGGDGASSGAHTVTVTDNYGEKTVPSPPERVVALDNRSFELLDAWGIKPVAAARALVPETIPGIAADDSIVDIGNHREPDLEAVVAAEPDVVISGQRFTSYDEELAALVPDAVVLNFEPRDGESFDQELIRHTRELGTVFGKEAEAEQAIDDFNAAVERARNAYDKDQTVMAVIVSGGQIGYAAPGDGRTWGPLFELVGFTPALVVDDASTDHQGDDISVEAIAASNPDFLLVLDRDAGTKTGDDSPEALSVINDSAALQNVSAVQNDHIYLAPADTYTNESIITYTEILNGIADEFENAS